MNTQPTPQAANLVALLQSLNLTCATAESCTGGGVGSAITAVPGSSSVYYGGIVSYDNSVKANVLGVPRDILETRGAVSPECAAAMAEGARRLLNVDLAVSVTGIAGPGGGSPEKPVGLVWFGIAGPKGVRTEKALLKGDRQTIRQKAVTHALGMLAVSALP